MESTNRELTKSTYEKMMEQFYEGLKKYNEIDERKESSTLPMRLLSVTKDEVVASRDLGPPKPKLIASRNVTGYENGSSSKELFGGDHISSKAKVQRINMGIPTKPKETSAAELDGLLMEAKSSSDSSWYDVATILNHRVTGSGEIEARVRFSGFDRSHDEWVNVKKSIRERSIPLVESECHLVEVGDLVLCFRKRGYSELYYDAHIMQIERNLHDIQGCRCNFQVHYDHDNDEEIVDVSKLCRRPSR